MQFAGEPGGFGGQGFNIPPLNLGGQVQQQPQVDPAFCYIVISPDPRYWEGMDPVQGVNLPTKVQTQIQQFQPPNGSCYFIKIGDQQWGCTRDEDYKTPNPTCKFPFVASSRRELTRIFI